MDRVSAEREMEDVEAVGESHWRLDGSPDGKQQEYIDRSLREALTEALAERIALEDEGTREKLEEQIQDAQKAVAELMTLGLGEDIDVKAGPCCVSEDDPVKWIESVADLIEALGERCEALIKQVEDAKDTAETAVVKQKVTIVRPALGPRRPRVGSTTMTLPLLAANDVVIEDTVPTSIVPVKAEREPKKRGRKPKAKKTG
jgi:hypothetical protein